MRLSKTDLAKVIIGYSILLAMWFSIAFIFNRVFEFLEIIISYSALRWCFPMTYHAKTTKKCLISSSITFILLIVLSIPSSISLLFAIIMSYILCYLLYIIQLSIVSTRKSMRLANKNYTLVRKLEKI